jgi:alpha-L-glutamate ligase-like protein
MILRTARALRALGVLGLNERNSEFTGRHNPRHLYPTVDDKLETKRLALAAGLAVPALYGVVEIEHQILELQELLSNHADFVIKPAHGSGGDGVLVVKESSNQSYQLVDGTSMDQAALNYHVSNILGGLYSLGGHTDKALIEYRIEADEVFAPVSYAGVPDIRIVVFLGVPVMAMLRLPTRASAGKANLHQGAIGVGVDMSSGRTLTGVLNDSITSVHPDTGNPVINIAIPHWQRLLDIAARCYELTGLGYIGVDVVLDRDKGPLILEINARPGLNIQLANCSGLIPRLRSVEVERVGLAAVDARVEFAKRNFVAD